MPRDAAVEYPALAPYRLPFDAAVSSAGSQWWPPGRRCSASCASSTAATPSSADALRLLHRVQALAVVTAGYLALGFAATEVVLERLHPTNAGVVLAWFAAQALGLTGLALVAVLRRLLAGAVVLRQEQLPV